MSNLSQATSRISANKQSLHDAYRPPDNFLEVTVTNPITHGFGPDRYTDYEVSIKTNISIFRKPEFSCRRRFSDFFWLREEIKERVQIHVPKLPPKAYLKQIILLNSDDGIFEPDFIEDRRQHLERFINSVASHPLVQSEKCLHMFLQREIIDKANYRPGRIRL